VTAGAPIEKENCDTPTVQKQTPAAGTQVQANQAVTYQLCKAPDKVTVPDLVGFTKEAAAAALEKQDLKADFKNVDSDRPVNTVTKVDKVGEQVDPGTTISVSISRGNLVPVPNVVGQTQEDAIQALQQAGLNANVKQGDPSPTPGIVSSQDPGQGKKLAKGKSVTIVVTVEPNPDESETPTPGTTTPGGNGAGNAVSRLLLR
jgi:eukaryotic-like serine/threonine-protein kinase